MSLNIKFISSNEHKIKEAQEILSGIGVSLYPISFKIKELQTEDPNELLKDKALKAFERVGRPLFVEHTCLFLDRLPNLPGGLTQVFWDNLKAELFSELFGAPPNTGVIAKTYVGYIDGKRFHTFEGQIKGKISEKPLGPVDFQWDCVFIPDGYTQTFAELGSEKNKISMRRKALDQFSKFLKDHNNV